MTEPQIEPALTIPQVAQKYAVRPDTVRLWIKTGKLRAIRLGKGYRIRPEDLRLFEQERVTVKPKQQEPDADTYQRLSGAYEGRGWGDDEKWMER